MRFITQNLNNFDDFGKNVDSITYQRYNPLIVLNIIFQTFDGKCFKSGKNSIMNESIFKRKIL